MVDLGVFFVEHPELNSPNLFVWKQHALFAVSFLNPSVNHEKFNPCSWSVFIPMLFGKKFMNKL